MALAAPLTLGAIASPPDPQDGQARRDVRELRFGSPQEAERFFDAFNHIIESQGRRPNLDVTLSGNSVLLSGSPKLIRAAAILTGCDGQEQWAQKQQESRTRQRQRSRFHIEGLLDQAARNVAHRYDRPGNRERKREEVAGNAEIRLFRLSYARASDLVDLVEMVGEDTGMSWRIEVDERTNTLVLKSSPRLIEEVEQLICRLDVPSDRPDQILPGPDTVVVPLRHADTTELAQVLNKVCRARVRSVVLSPDRRTNTLVLAGQPRDLAKVLSLIKQLDTSAPPCRASGMESRAEEGDRKNSTKRSAGRRRPHQKQKPSAGDDEPPHDRGGHQTLEPDDP